MTDPRSPDDPSGDAHREDFPALPFATMSEQDVREEVIAPVLRRLGYRTGTDFDLRRGVTLRYHRTQLGRRKPHDPELIGMPDYVCTVNEHIRWTIEAKPPSESVDDELAIAQSRSYAMHHEVGAAYHALCNGRELAVFDTLLAPRAEHALRVRYEDLDQRWPEVEGVLGAAGLLRLHESRARQRGRPLGPGLGSVVEVASGSIRFKQAGQVDPYLAAFVKSGNLDRGDDGKLRLVIEAGSGMPAYQDINTRIGFGRLEFVGDAQVLSSTSATVFSGTTSFTLPSGERLPIPHNATMVTLLRDVPSTMEYRATVTLHERELRGAWKAVMHAPGLFAAFGLPPPVPMTAFPIDGDVVLRLV